MSEQLQVVAFLTKPDFCEPYVGLHRDSMTTGTSEPLMTVAQHERIVAAKEAEIAQLHDRLTANAAAALDTAALEQALDDECGRSGNAVPVGIPLYSITLPEIIKAIYRTGYGAQPARQVGGDETEAFIEWANKEYEITDGYELNLSNYDLLENKKGWMARAALAPAAVVMPCRADERQSERYMNGWNSALDEVARLNRRAIPVGLLEQAASMLEAHSPGSGSVESYCAQDIRALLGKEGE